MSVIVRCYWRSVRLHWLSTASKLGEHTPLSRAVLPTWPGHEKPGLVLLEASHPRGAAFQSRLNQNATRIWY